MGPPMPASPPPTSRPEFALGMKLHNEGSYFEAHEAWEELWQHEDDDRTRLFLQGLIQVTSAFHKLFFQREPVGAGRLLARGLTKLDAYPDEYLGVALGPFRTAAHACAAEIARLAPTKEAAAAYDRAKVPALRMQPP
jgi:predicted metal-dependent hydrolase